MGAEMSEDVLAQRLNVDEYVVVQATRGARDPRGAALIYVILAADGSKYITKSADFWKLINGARSAKKGDPIEIIIVGGQAPSTHIKRNVESIGKKYGPDYSALFATYAAFAIEVPRHVSVPRHEIAEGAEIDKFCREYHVAPTSFPKLIAGGANVDAMALWMGFKPGMVIKITRLSETTGLEIAYRYCEARVE